MLMAGVSVHPVTTAKSMNKVMRRFGLKSIRVVLEAFGLGFNRPSRPKISASLSRNDGLPENHRAIQSSQGEAGFSRPVLISSGHSKNPKVTPKLTDSAKIGKVGVLPSPNAPNEASVVKVDEAMAW
jgi:hypothetical protein